MSNDHVDATFYVQVEGDLRYAGQTKDPIVRGARATRITQSRPSRPVPGSVLVKLTVRVPTSAFLPLRPEAVVVIPVALAEHAPITVDADDPHQTPGSQTP